MYILNAGCISVVSITIFTTGAIALLKGIAHNLRAILKVELSHDATQVSLHCPWTNLEALANFFVGKALHNLPENSLF
jgi:hypothetical protein